MGQHEIERMMPGHFDILNLCLAGYRVKDIAQAVGMTAQAVSLITNAPIFQHELSRRRGNVNQQIDSNLASVPMRAKALLEQNAERAVQVHVELLSADNPKHRQD